MGIPNLGQWVAPWRLVQTQTLDTLTKFVDLDVDFDSESFYRIVGICGSASGAVQPGIVVNGDIGANYNYLTASMVSPGTYSGTNNAVGYVAPIAPGFSGGVSLSVSEQVLLDCYIYRAASKILIASKTFTNGSAEGDNHFMISEWSGVAASLQIRTDISPTGAFPPSFYDNFALGTRFDLCALNGNVLWAT